MAKKKSKTLWRIYWIMMFLIIVPALLIVDDTLRFALTIIASIAAVMVSFILATVIHELGHLFFGLLFKFRFVSFSVLFFNFYIENEKVKFRFCMPKAFAGYCIMIPKYNPIHKFLWFIAGGILFNVVSGLFFLYIYIASGSSALFFIILSFMSIALAVLNAVPIKKDLTSNTDGWKIKTILFKKEELDDFIEATQISDMMLEGLRPRDYKVKIDKNEEYDTSRYITFFYKALDSGDKETASYCSKKIEENFDSYNEVTFLRFCYIICYTSCITGNIEKAKLYYGKCRKRAEKDNDCNGYRVRAYYEYYANNNAGYAYELCQKGLDVADKFIFKGHAMMEKDLMEKLQTQIIESKK